jgi:hypothetical protein
MHKKARIDIVGGEAEKWSGKCWRISRVTASAFNAVEKS